MNIIQATTDYEAWVEKSAPLVKEDLALKHQRMAESPFMFLRATFYRWMQLWPRTCPDLAAAPELLAVGDLHVENFGTWRDAEGRLTWGVNDFDEAYRLPWPLDLVRLATSALLAIGEEGLEAGAKKACAAILAGYGEGLAAGGRPLVLAENNTWLREMAESELRDPVRYWKKLDALKECDQVPVKIRQLLIEHLPRGYDALRIVHRQAGLGSLGRPRYTAVAHWYGGRLAREAKALVPSSCVWAGGGKKNSGLHYEEIISRAVHCPDTFLQIHGEWGVRRLAPDCSRIELDTFPDKRDEIRILHSMGWETANIHLGSKDAAPAVRADLRSREGNWLYEAAGRMHEALLHDWEDWKDFYQKK